MSIITYLSPIMHIHKMCDWIWENVHNSHIRFLDANYQCREVWSNVTVYVIGFWKTVPNTEIHSIA